MALRFVKISNEYNLIKFKTMLNSPVKFQQVCLVTFVSRQNCSHYA